jgi:hypothetical protein
VTRIGNGCFLMAYAHIAHDCIVGNHVVMANTAGIAGEVVVHDKAFISAAVTVHQFCRIGRNAMIGLSAKVVQDALPFCITDGNPGRARGLNLVGLKRNGFHREDIAALKEAYRMLYARVPLDQALARCARWAARRWRKSPTSSPARSAASPTRRAERSGAQSIYWQGLSRGSAEELPQRALHRRLFVIAEFVGIGAIGKADVLHQPVAQEMHQFE